MYLATPSWTNDQLSIPPHHLLIYTIKKYVVVSAPTC